MGRKHGQIAHIDRNRANNGESNLAFLCLPHHDEYDSRTSQSKGITQAELVHARNELNSYIEANFGADTVSISITIKGDFDSLSEEQRHALLNHALREAKIRNSVHLISTSRGSIVFRIKITANDAVAILDAFNEGRMKAVDVVGISEAPLPLKNVSFDVSFDSYSHGVRKGDAAKTLLAPDSAEFFDGRNRTTPEQAVFGLYLRRISNQYSLLVIADRTPTIQAAFPICHRDVPLSLSTSPFQALTSLVDRFGVPIRVDGSSSKLMLGERVRLPRAMSVLETVKYFENRAEEGYEGGQYELFSLVEQGRLLSDYRLVHLLFTLSKQQYLASLRSHGLRVEGAHSGRYVSTKERDT